MSLSNKHTQLIRRVGNNCLLVHGNVARLYRERFQKSQKGQIGIALVSLSQKDEITTPVLI